MDEPTTRPVVIDHVTQGTAVSATCRGCARAQRRAARLGQWIRCDRCGTEWSAAPAPSAQDAAPAPTPLTPEQATQITGADMAVLAKWVAQIEGHAAGLEPTIATTAPDRVRPQDADRRSFRHALEVHARLEAMRAGPGRLHVAVLRFVYLQRTGGSATGLGDLYGEVGALFATQTQRAAWKAKRKSLRSAAPQKHGRALHDAATMAYAVRKTGRPAGT